MPRPLIRYGAAGLAAGLALALTLGLWPVMQRIPSALFFAAVVAAAWYGGPGPALLATALGAGGHLFMTGGGTVGAGAVLPVAAFVVVALALTLFAYRRQRVEHAYRASEQRLQAIIDGSSAVVYRASGVQRAGAPWYGPVR